MVSELEFFFWHSQAEEDVKLFNALLRHIEHYKWYRRVRISSSGSTEAGSSVTEDLEEHLSSAQIIFLLTSSAFPWIEAEKYEQRWRSRSRTGNVKIISIKLRPCSLDMFKDFIKALPIDGKSIAISPIPDEALDNVARTLDWLIQEFLDRYDQVHPSGVLSTSVSKGEIALKQDLSEKAKSKELDFRKIEEHKANGRHKEILELCKQMLFEYPEEAFSLHIHRGEALEQLLDYPNALAAYEAARSMPYVDSRPWILIGELFWKRDLRYDAVRTLQSTKSLFSRDPALLALLIEMLISLGRYEEALEEIEEAQQKNIRYESIYSDKGSAYLVLRRYKEAIQAFDQALLQGNNSLAIYLNKGVAYSNLKDFDNASKAYSAGIAYYPTNCSLWQGKGDALYALQSWREAKEAYEQAISYATECPDLLPDLHGALADVFYELQYYDLALDQCKRMLNLSPENAKAFLKRIAIHKKMIEPHQQQIDDLLKLIQADRESVRRIGL